MTQWLNVLLLSSGFFNVISLLLLFSPESVICFGCEAAQYKCLIIIINNVKFFL